jgi:hypothetical protein
MAKTILESFRELKTKLEITELQQSAVSTIQQNVRKAVVKVLDSILFYPISDLFTLCDREIVPSKLLLLVSLS